MARIRQRRPRIHTRARTEREKGERSDRDRKRSYLNVTHGLERRKDEHKTDAQDENHQKFHIHHGSWLL